MKGTIIESNNTTVGPQSTSVQTDYGVLIGTWDGPSPPVNTTVYIEFEFESEGDPTARERAEFIATSPAAGRILLSGIAEGWSDGLLDLRVGPSLIQVELPCAVQLGGWLTVKGRQLKFFDVNL